MRPLQCFTWGIGLLVAVVVGPAPLSAAEEMPIYVATPLGKAAQAALVEFQHALSLHEVTPRDVAALPKSETPAIVIGVAGASASFDAFLSEAKVEVCGAAESSTAAWVEDRKQTLVLAGRDDRGLTYALRDATRGLAVAPHPGDWKRGITPAVESPFLRVRNVSVHLFNADCEREWFFSEEFWRDYFARLSLSRFNRCTLTFCDQTNYLCPPYAYLVAMPEYPQVKVEDCTPEQREANLAMLARIAELADEYAVDFDLGIWMQAPVPKWSAPVKVTGLPEGMELAKYCALGLQRIYQACPSLDGIQLRMNAEAGVSEEQQTEFYRPLFKALAATGRPLRVDLRYKGLLQATIDAALAEKLDVTVSTKFWAEHFGLPYHPTVVDSHYAADRYSFGTLLKKPRKYRVTYQLWTVGSQRVTLWGDPDYAAKFAHSCKLGDGEGFEVFAPLTNKGYGNAPGAWNVIADPAYRVGKWEQERYWMFYLCFGRMGYDPETKPEVWQREFRHRFGDEAAQSFEAAYRAASQVLPLITTALLPGASEWSWWPEMDTGGNIAEYSRIQTSDPGQFAAMQEWKKTPDWRWEEWDVRPGQVEELTKRRLSGRTHQYDLSWMLDGHARAIDRELDRIRHTDAPEHAERRMTEVDLRLLRSLAFYHSKKLEAATCYAHWEVLRNVQGSLAHATTYALTDAAKHWSKVVETTDGIYHHNLVFGVTPDSPRSKQGHHHSGHWKDRLGEIETDVEAVKKAVDGADDVIPLGGDIRMAFITLGPPELRHDSAALIQPKSALPLRLSVIDSMPHNRVERAVVHIRPLDQTREWKSFEMTKDVEGEFVSTIPETAIDPHYDIQYYFQVFMDGRVALWPDWRKGQPYFVVPVEAK